MHLRLIAASKRKELEMPKVDKKKLEELKRKLESEVDVDSRPQGNKDPNLRPGLKTSKPIK